MAEGLKIYYNRHDSESSSLEVAVDVEGVGNVLYIPRSSEVVF